MSISRLMVIISLVRRRPMKILTRLILSPIILLMGIVSTLVWIIKGPGWNDFDAMIYKYVEKVG